MIIDSSGSCAGFAEKFAREAPRVAKTLEGSAGRNNIVTVVAAGQGSKLEVLSTAVGTISFPEMSWNHSTAIERWLEQALVVVKEFHKKAQEAGLPIGEGFLLVCSDFQDMKPHPSEGPDWISRFEKAGVHLLSVTIGNHVNMPLATALSRRPPIRFEDVNLGGLFGHLAASVVRSMETCGSSALDFLAEEMDDEAKEGR